ncbi:unnamed protein product [Symbiodinium pilosum]|uniref:Mitochondrial cardiolipin hydrolase n=1 Tax=Symbiodinium pilosum TaxID=2952 RepID=A0A812J8B2_SYMPI|nr:unnamed protein product [Symbiodinium pilosum]
MGCSNSAFCQFSAVSDSEESDASSSSLPGRLNINDATVAELVSLPGIGRKKAENIVAYREEHGRFESLDDLAAVPGFCRRGVDKVADMVTLDDSGDESGCLASCCYAGAEACGSSCCAPCTGGCWCLTPFSWGDTDEAIFFPDDASGSGLARLLEVLDSARRTLDIAVFSISYKPLAEALVRAHRRGVMVRILSDDMQAKQQNSAVPDLIREGLQLRLDVSEKFHMHHKFVISDDATLISGSLNWTHAAVERGNENVVISRRSALCRRFALEFERVWAAFQDGNVAKAPPAEFDGNVAALFFPESQMQNVGLILTELQGARSSIEIAIFTLTLDTLTDTLLKKHQQGLRVRIITDNRQAAVPGADAQRLHQAGLEVRTDKSWYAMHHKFAVIDKQTLINGSFNWTAQATKGNQEDAIIFRWAASHERLPKVAGLVWERHKADAAG